MNVRSLTLISLFSLCFIIDAPANSTLSRDSIDLDNFDVIASRVSDEDPKTFLRLTKEQIAIAYHGQDPSSLFDQIAPSIQSYSDAGSSIGNYVQFRMRGIDQTRLNFTLDGVPLNDMIDQGVFFSNFSDLISSIDNIQIQRGLGASSSGVAAYGGAINFQSERLFNQDSWSALEILGGSFGTYRISAETKFGAPDGWQSYGRFSKIKSDGYKYNSGSDAYSLFYSGGYSWNEQVVKILAFSGKTQNDQSYLPVLLDDIQIDPKTNYNHPNDTDDFEQEMVQVQYGRSLSNGWSVNNTLYYGGARGVFPFGLDDTFQLVFGIENDHYGFISNWSAIKPNYTFHTGIHAYIFDRQNQNYTAPNRTFPDYTDETTKKEFSFFGKYNRNFGSINSFVDVQFRHVKMDFDTDQVLSYGGPVPSGIFTSSRDWTFLNYQIGINYSLQENLTIYGSYGRTSREPTRTDLLMGDGSSINELNYMSLLDPTMVKEESVKGIELGLKHRDSRLYIDFNLFHLNYSNEISQVGALAARSYVPLRQNVEDSRRSGLESVVKYNIQDKMALGLNGTYLSTNVQEFISGSETFENVNHVFAPKIMLSPNVAYEISQDVSIRLAGRYSSRSFMELSNDLEFELPAYFRLDANLHIDIAEGLSVSCMLNNIFNATYYHDGAPVDLDFDGAVEGPGFRIQPPRNFYVMMRWKI